MFQALFLEPLPDKNTLGKRRNGGVPKTTQLVKNKAEI